MRTFGPFLLLIICRLFNTLQASCAKRDDIDYIVVGSGATGAAVASRLSELSSIKVLLLEAGGQPLPVSKIPLISYRAMGSKMDWNYRSVPQTHCCQSLLNETIPLSRGKALGGTTSINSMVYHRSSPKDFDLWKELGNEGWGWDDLKPYFMNLEDYQVPMSRDEEPYHHIGGLVSVEIPPFKSVMANAFLEIGRELGYRRVDYNTKDNVGFMYPPVTIRNGERCGTDCSYLKPAMWRENLVVETYAFVTKILFDDGKKNATGVMYENKEGDKCYAYAKKEVIVSGGAFNSPQLLLLSGIGPKEQLKKYDIDLVKELKGVGENLQDHVTMGVIYILDQFVGMNSVQYETTENEDLWHRTKTGPMTVPFGFEGVAFLKTNVTKDDDPNWPDVEIYFNSGNGVRFVKPLLKQFAASISPPDEEQAITFQPILLRPKSTGTVQLQSRDPHVQPRIDPQLMSHVYDLEVMTAAVEIIQTFGQTKALAQYGAKLTNSGIFVPCLLEIFGGLKAYMRCFVRMFSSSGNHPTSTCKMGPASDEMAVVDSNLRVHGIKNLRVADASIMPNIVTGHPQVPCMVIGEKLADMIKKELGR